MKATRKNRVIGRVIVLAMALCLLFCMAIPVSASEEQVRATADGVLFFSIKIDGQAFGRGSCFLINEDTIITSNHCVHFSKAEYEAYYNTYGLKQDYIDKKLTYQVTLQRDFTIPATLVNSSENMDFAILKLSQPINNRKSLPLRDSTKVEAAEVAYSVGFPAIKDTVAKNAQYYNSKDMIFEAGTINRAQYTDRFRMTYGYDFIGDVLMITATTIRGGNSGGPLIDAEGNVIGICMASDGGSCYASAISQVMEVLDTLGTKYTAAGALVKPDDDTDAAEVDYSKLQASISKAEGRDKTKYTEESYQKLSDALVSAKAALSAKTQDEVDLAKNNLDRAIYELKPAKSNTALIVIIAIVVVVIVAVGVVLAIVLGGRKKGDSAPAAPAPAPAPAFAQPTAPKQITVNTSVGTTVAPPDSGETTVLSGDGSETTVLSGDGGETTVLSQQVDGGKLIRAKNNENIPITYSGFTIGKKRKEVDYCVGDNTNISRNHAKFIVRDGVTYIVDNKSTNGTFVNNVTVRPGQEVEIKDGDVIMLADEKFEYKK